MKASWLKYFPITTLRQVGAGWSAKSARRAGLYLPHANRRSRGYSTALDRLPMSVYYGSQSGTAQMLAHLFTQEADQQDIQAEVFDLDEFSGDEFMKEQVIVLIMATFGEGEVTDNARKFYDWLTSPARTKEEFAKAKVMLFGLGNSRAYAERYQKASKDVEKRLSEFDVSLEVPRGEGDDAGEIEDDFEAWKERVWARLHGQSAGEDNDADTKSKKPELTEDNLTSVPLISVNLHDGKGIDWRAADSLDNPIPAVIDHKNPVPCEVMVNRELCNSAKTGRSARHIEVDIKGRLTYQTGDHVGVSPLNDPDLVQRFCDHMGYDLDAAFSYPKDSTCQGRKFLCESVMSVREAFYRLLDLQALPGRVTVETLARFATDPTERAELFAISRPHNKELYKEQIAGEYIGVAELCLRYPSIKVPLGNMMEMLPRIQSRFYSISSSSSMYPDSLHMSVSVVNTPLPNGSYFKGLCSNFIKRTTPGTDTMRMFVRQSLFRMPPDPSNQPMIMIAAGAGFAPLRAFLQERDYLKNQGVSLAPAHLYFGTTAPDQDFIYADELNEYQKSGILEYFHPSFCDVPGPNGEKFVQHFMTRKEDMALLSEQLAAGGRIYVCGRANTVGVGVDDALVQILEKHPIPGMGNLTAKEYLLNMRHDYRYNLDVFAE